MKIAERLRAAKQRGRGLPKWDEIEHAAAALDAAERALADLVAIDDGDQPALWGWHAQFNAAEAALALLRKEQP